MFGKSSNCPAENKICAYCEHAQVIGGGDACICSFNGVVHGDSVCRKFRFDLLKYKPRITKLPVGEALDFNID